MTVNRTLAARALQIITSTVDSGGAIRGTNHMSNLALAHRSCNRDKSSLTYQGAVS